MYKVKVFHTINNTNHGYVTLEVLINEFLSSNNIEIINLLSTSSGDGQAHHVTTTILYKEIPVV
jgi:hypothetical protein